MAHAAFVVIIGAMIGTEIPINSVYDGKWPDA
jgi:hypothetical protein